MKSKQLLAMLFIASAIQFPAYAVNLLSNMSTIGDDGNPATQGNGAYSNNRYYNIAHMVNSAKLVDWAVSSGSNAIEADLKFNGTTPDKFHHGGLCDCSVGIAQVCVASYKLHNTYCGVTENVTSYLNHVATKPLALIIIDNKADTISPATGEKKMQAGAHLIAMLDKELFAKGYKGNVIVGVAKMADSAMIDGAINWARFFSPNKTRIYFAIDQETNVTQVVSYFKNNAGGRGGTPNGVYGTGVSSNAPFHYYYDEITQAKSYVKSGEIKMAYIWSIDDDKTMRNYLNVGANGVMTNDPADLSKVYTEFFKTACVGCRLAVPGDPL